MAETAPAPKPQRLISLDAFRGMTIAGMLLVNNPGDWGHIYWPLAHAHWNGWTFTDLIFPFFLFIMGVAMVFSFAKRLDAGENRAHLFGHVVRRAFTLILLGYIGAAGFFLPPPAVTDPVTQASTTLGFWASWSAVGTGGIVLRLGFILAALALVVLLAGSKRPAVWAVLLVAGAAVAAWGGAQAGGGDPLWQRLASCRWPGVLVRIGLCYLLASALIFWSQSPRFLVGWIAGLLTVYGVWMVHIPVPGFGPPDLSIPVENVDGPGFSGQISNWAVYFDTHLLGMHSYQTIPSRAEIWDGAPQTWGFDPEGVLSTLGAVCTVLCGYLTGLWLRRPDKTPPEKTLGMFIAGNWLLLAGLAVSIWFPINKKIWTSSYVLFMAGMALVIFGMTYHTMDVKGRRRWLMPFVWFGTNAITAFYFSGLMATLLGRLKVSVTGADGAESLMGWNRYTYEHLLLPWAGETNASLLFAVGFVLLWTAIMGVLYRAKIFLKI